MTTVQLRQKENYDKHRKHDPNLKSGDMVWLLPRNVKTTRPSKKLDYKKMGPLKIIKKVGTSSYKLDLPASMKIHNTFHITLLEPYEDNKFPSRIQTPPPPIEIDRESEYELEEIINSRLHRNKPNTVPSGPVSLQNTTRPGTQQKTSKMPASPLNGSTPGTPGNQEWVHVTITRSASEPRAEKRDKTPTPPPATVRDGWNDDRFLPRNVTPTSPPYSGPVETKEQRKARKATIHPGLSWTACYDDLCPVHLREKQGEGWFPQKPIKKEKEPARDMEWETA